MVVLVAVQKNDSCTNRKIVVVFILVEEIELLELSRPVLRGPFPPPVFRAISILRRGKALREKCLVQEDTVCSGGWSHGRFLLRR